MPRITYIGYPSKLLGKHLLWLLGNLKDFGVGRVVTRHTYNKRYSEPCYYVIKKVQPCMDDNNQYGMVWAETVFRGRKIPGVQLIPSAFLPDFHLVPKSEEHNYLHAPVDEAPPKVLPRYLPFAPLLRKMVLRDMKAKGLDTSQEPMLEAVYRAPKTNTYRIAEEGEAPNVEFTKENLFVYDRFRSGVKDI